MRSKKLWRPPFGKTTSRWYHEKKIFRGGLAMNIPANIFREYDIRGNAEEELTSPNVRAIGKAFGTFLAREGVNRVTVGGDIRLSTERIRGDIIAGLTSAGIDVVNLGTVTSPLLYWSLFHLNLNGGVMITGSHNPKEFNGLKLAFGKTTLYGDQIQEIRRMIQADDLIASPRPGQVKDLDLTEDYLGMLRSKITLGPRKLKVVTDPANATAGPMVNRFLRDIGCDVIPLFEKPDGNFPNHHPDPTKREYLVDLIDTVRREGADLGIGFDGDADRIGVVDNNGDVVWGDILMILFWREILPLHPGADAIVEVKS
jgi:phosphomannomutase/phosphoglucomutase